MAEANDPLAADTFDDGDSALGSHFSGSLMSLRSSVLAYESENGRTYHALSAGKYIMPNDEPEKERLDMVHYIWVLTTGGRHVLCPKNDNAKRVLDIGTGTGIWAIEYADAHPDTEVVGVDLSAIQPTFVPPNCSFEVDDLEKDWTWSKPFDLIFARSMIASFTDWPSFMAKAFKQLEPGGYLELHDHSFPIRCDDNTLPRDTPILQWTELIIEACDKIGRECTVALRFKEMMEAAGFEDVVEKVFKWPTNAWPRDHKYKELGAWSLAAGLQGIEAMTLALFTRVLGWSQEQTLAFCAEVRNNMKSPKIHGYWAVYMVYGRKPLNVSAAESAAIETVAA
ncbi:S-adenosyl-L-methionine-dependent methyltransferase [Podospora didyma]|uniref:S-adenosyl-L-methionine-dependent methyltransferase n=1 Tax=Podospora didyma TaxID=330526 RepID=A0AAE0NPU5_9PEZI|nr:S-adenosyl-L-methionine-dependent methyltransferase [Podospora didyma]